MSPHSSRQGYFIFNFSRNSFGSLFKNSGFLLWLLLVGLFYFPSALHAQTGPSHSKYVVGYYAEWAIYGRDFNVSDIKAENLTHLMYAFYDTKFNRATIVTTLEEIDRYADIEHTEDPGINHNSKVKGNLGAMKLLKEKNPHLVILISLGGWPPQQMSFLNGGTLQNISFLKKNRVCLFPFYPVLEMFQEIFLLRV